MPWALAGAAVVGGVGSYLSGQTGKSNSYKGFSYLANSPVGTSIVPNAGKASDAEAGLLGIGGDPAAATKAYNNYFNSAGYQTQLQQGSQAITTNNAAKGMLNSGATLKALTKYGQAVGQSSFNNYLGLLSGVTNQGLTGAGQIGQAGTEGGANAAKYSSAGTSGIFSALGSLF